MHKYIKLKKQFVSFIEQFRGKECDKYFVTLLNLIIENFDEIADSGTAAGKRAKLLYEIIQNQASQTTDELYKETENEKSIERESLLRLHSLQVEKFRGFTQKQVFNLEKQFLLIYGMNGSGKSSFCEALEYCLLGDINEAHEKRIHLQDYVKNSDYGAYVPPILKGVDNTGVLINVEQNYDLFHFCFIEKCRIDSFARISSHTPADQAGLISILFGLEEFNAFVKEFTENIENYIPLESSIEKNYKLKLLEVENYNNNKKLYEDELKKIIDKQSLIAKESKLKDTFVELNMFINGNSEILGRLKEIQDEIQKEQPEKSEFKNIETLLNDLDNLKLESIKFEELQSDFINKINEINLTGLYKALITIEIIETEICPACETPLQKTTKNPFINAKERLKELSSISELQLSRDVSWVKLVEKTSLNIKEILNFIDALKKANKTIGVLLPKELLHPNPNIAECSSYVSILRFFISEFSLKKEILFEYQNDLNKLNADFNSYKLKKEKLFEEQRKLTEINLKITGIKSEERNFQSLLQKAKDEILAFETNNEQTLKQIEIEKKQIEENLKYVSAYKFFREKLFIYKENLPLKLVENLNDYVKEFYNQINQDDQDFELLAEVILPTKANDIIKVSFRDNPAKFENALHVLSEGHIKCLGLSILLSKCVNSGLNILIFDDVVNAIDDDHRGRISELLFKNEYFKDKQILITSHSEEFIKDIENLLFSKDEYDTLVGKIIFNKRLSKKIEYIESVFHYLKKAEVNYNESNKRDCLLNIRRCLESLSDYIWKKLTNFEKSKYNIEITVPIRYNTKRPDLMNLVTGIRKCLQKIISEDNSNEKLQSIKEHLEWFLGLETNSPRIWDYLNKGTHDESERDDFDNSIVRKVLDKAISLEEVAKAKWK